MKTKPYSSKLDENIIREQGTTQPKTDYVPTQEELLNGGKPAKKPSEKSTKKLTTDPRVTQALNRTLDEAAQEGNIGGG
jgi:hypothetical protein